MAATPWRHEVFYPESDGKPMGETGIHVTVLLGLLGLVRQFFRDREDVYAAANMFLYYIEGDPRSCVVPDLYVARGVAGKHERRTFQVWKEGRPPVFVLEVTSPSTRREDLHRKRDLYARLGVEEYFLFDPLDEYLDPPLQGFELDAAGRYLPKAPLLDGALTSRTLGLTFRPAENGLRLVETATGEALLDLEELARERDEARAASRRDRAARQEAEAVAREAEARMAAETAARRALEERLARLEGK